MSCFTDLVGLARPKQCDCGAPDGTDTTSEWKYEIFVSDSPANPLVLTLSHALPATIADLQVFEAGELVDESRISGFGTTSLSIDDPLDNTTYQVWYLADVPDIDLPAYSVSKSGLYISDLLPETELRGLETCDKSVWDVVLQSRETAIGEFIASMNVAVKKKNKERYNKFSGSIGAPDGSGYLTSAYQFSGVRIRTNPIKSGYLRINRILALFERSGDLNITVYSGDGTVMTPTFPIKMIGGRKSITEVGLTLPLLNDFNTCQDYYIVYTYDANNRPLLNKSWCGCPGTMVPVTSIYHFGHGEWLGNYTKSTAWNNYMIVGGIETNDVNSFSDQSTTVGGYMNGLAIDVEIGCDLTAGLCKMFSGGPEVQAAATFIQRTAAALSVQKKNISSIPNRDNIAKGEEQLGYAAEWLGEAAESMEYLTSSVTDEWNDCVQCIPRMSMGEIRT